jgi:hypothetical protein
MKHKALVLFVLPFSAVAVPYPYASPYPQLPAAAGCDPKNTPTALQLGKPIPMKIEDVPVGCSDFEILVGMNVISSIFNNPTNAVIARGTTERNRDTAGEPPGKFGIVVGDPLVDNLLKIMPNARGYPVQVLTEFVKITRLWNK